MAPRNRASKAPATNIATDYNANGYCYNTHHGYIKPVLQDIVIGYMKHVLHVLHHKMKHVLHDKMFRIDQTPHSCLLLKRKTIIVYMKHQSVNMKHQSVRCTTLSIWVSMSWLRGWSCWNRPTWRVKIFGIWKIERHEKTAILWLPTCSLCSKWLNVGSPYPHFNATMGDVETMAVKSHRWIPCGGPFYQRGPYQGRFIGHDDRQMLEGRCRFEEDQIEQMDKDVEDLLAVGDEFKNRWSLVHLLDSPFPAKQSLTHN